MEASRSDVEALMREKYNGNRDAKGVAEDVARLEGGEPLAYVIGNIPFLGLTIYLDSHPLIPRPETEWWTEELIKKIGNQSLHILDLCAGSGAIGLALLRHCPNARVSFGELVETHKETIRKNIELNELDIPRADICIGDLFSPFVGKKFDCIVSNPPYIPESRLLDASVTEFEPREALYSGTDGLTLIRRTIEEAPHYLTERGEIWIECDVSNIKEAREIAAPLFKETEIRNDQYGRPRVLVARL